MNKDCCCQIPCNSLPMVGETDFGLALKPYVHCDRIADYHVLIYLLKGEMEIIEEGVTYLLTPGTLFFLKSGLHHWGEKPFKANTAWYYIHFYTNEIGSNMQPLELRDSITYNKSLSLDQFRYYITLPKILHLPIGNNLETDLEKLIGLFHDSKQTSLVRMNLSLWNILLNCFELGQGKSENAKEDSRTKEMINYLEHNYTRNFTSTELEEVMGLTYKYVGTFFKENTGMTIKEYQLMLRIGRSVKLLCETDMPIAEIAAQTGFYDSFYFSKIFKREKGISPRKFRNTYIPKI
ncbi:AraC family transcriptional regulator [Anaeromicropila herbilytica]|uniref:Putative HTH-type transcriptional regulator YisR n=1 Tax=Anaeromicropila herbilytica TaxID=2785025 RepID=A0A7R7EL46_9FIRM|nr:AraC family transcriptional regulator [Anaeromicropila herbilytica]BCN30789.1 putative HTH-type transcriptional regulator YisR [Anaeromicropila herbilytica]